MQIEQNIKRYVNLLVEPSNAVLGDEARRRARLLSSLIIPFIILTPIGVRLSGLEAERNAVSVLFIVSVICYAFSRTRHYLKAGIVLTLFIYMPPYALLLSSKEFGVYNVFTWCSWMSLPILLSSLWLPLRLVTTIWIGNIVFLVTTPLHILPSLTYHELSMGVMQLIFFGSLILLGAAIRNTDLEKIMRQTRELKTTKEEAEEANKAKSMFLANMSHELRTPLHGILSFADFGINRTGSLPPARIVKYFTQIQISGERLLVLVNGLLDLAKLEAGKMELNCVKQELKQIITRCVAEQEGLIVAKRLHLTYDFPPEIPEIYCDEIKIGQVVANLLNNATKYAPMETKITISINSVVYTDDNDEAISAVQCDITDQGKGIAEEELDTIFGKFVQSSNNQYAPGGTGLGLAICRELVTLHGGKIWCRNEKFGGATFSFYIPIERKS